MGKLDDLISAVGKAAPESKYIRAYHGSPYDFDGFDASRIDTGEGAQVYGYGLYFADAEDAAKHYKTVQTPELTLDQERELTAVLKRMRELRGLTKDVPRADPRAAAMMEEWAKLQSRRAFLEDPPGHMYEVEIPHPAESLLDYDRPFSTPVGRLALSAVGDMLPAPPSRSLARDLRQGMGVEAAPRSGSRNAFDNAAGQLIDLAKTPPGASALLDAGIPGVRYLDGNSRVAQAGTRNYVMFPGTEDSIRILRKYGLLAPMAAGAMQDQ
jgi:hypothetical protein